MPIIPAAVSLPVLLRQHPMQADVERLRRMEEALRGSSGEARGSAVAAETSTYVLPALPLSGGDAAGRRAQLQQRERVLALRLRTAAARQVNVLVRGLNIRQARAREERQAQLTGIYAARDADTLRRIRAEVAETGRTQLEGLALAYANVNIQTDALLANLSILPVVYSPTDLEKEIVRLQANPKTYGISDRARLTLHLREVAEKRRVLDAQRQTIRQTAVDTIATARERLARESAAAIEAQLVLLPGGTEAHKLRVDQQRAIGDLLRSVRAGNRVSNKTERGLSADTAGVVALTGNESVSYDQVSALRLQSALQKVLVQRGRLENYIRADTVDAARDIAERNHIALEFVPDAASATDGRRDMTAQFATWLRQRRAGIMYAPTPLKPTSLEPTVSPAGQGR